MNEEKYTYYRIIPIERSDTLLLEKINPHRFILKGLIGIRRVRKKPHITVSFPQGVTEWFIEHEAIEYFPKRVLVIIPFNVDSEEDINVLMSIVKALYGFKGISELYSEKIRAGRVRPVETGLNVHYQSFLSAKTDTKLTIDKLYDLLRTVGGEETGNASTP
jgi:hypothetical protein